MSSSLVGKACRWNKYDLGPFRPLYASPSPLRGEPAFLILVDEFPTCLVLEEGVDKDGDAVLKVLLGNGACGWWYAFFGVEDRPHLTPVESL